MGQNLYQLSKKSNPVFGKVLHVSVRVSVDWKSVPDDAWLEERRPRFSSDKSGKNQMLLLCISKTHVASPKFIAILSTTYTKYLYKL